MGEKASININGKEMSFDSERKLIDVLRNDCKCKSVKDGCSEGACGTCTVLIDGKPMRACIQTIGRLKGKKVQTIEGFIKREREVYSYAFAICGAVQCGFCIPGMVVSAKGLIDINPNPSRIEIVAAIKNNICRCTGYKKIIDAIELSAKMLRENIEVKDYKGKIKVGDKRIARIDAKEKALGEGIYCDDIEIEGMIYGAAVRTKYPRAKILKIDISEAKKLNGVVDIITAKDLPASHKVGHLLHDWYILIGELETTKFIGDAVALIVAEDENTLKKAKELVKIEYEELPLIKDPIEALKEDSPLVHEDRENNLLTHEVLIKGNADEIIAKSKYKVTRHYELPWTEHAFLEPECAIATPLNDGVFIYSSDQGAYDTRREVSMALGIEPEKVVVENQYVGGGFGGKEDMSVQHYAAIMAYRTKRTVKFKLTRQESIYWHPKRHPMSIDMTTACDENGILTAMKAVLITDAGAYASLSGPVLQRACTHAAGPYNYQVIDIDGKSVYTNNPPTGPFRGFGVPQSCFATEMNINLLAEMCGLDAWEIRYRNAIKPGQILPNSQIAGESTGLVETLEAVKEEFYKNKNVGIACGFKNSGVGMGLPDTGRVRLIVEDNKVHIHSAATCIGQGIGTVLYQIVGETLNLDEDKIIYHNPNTSIAPDSGTTSGSRQTLITGEACKRACEKLKEELDKGKKLSDLNGQDFYGEWLTITDKLGADKPNPVSHVAYSYATQICILNEDGTINKVIAAHDIGKAINVLSLEGQIEGGVVMSLGYALTEKFPLENCIPKVKFGTLGLLKADKTPDVESIIIEKEGVPYAYGATGIGEISSIPTAPAVAAAYYKMNGEFQTELPLKNTPYSK
ncbi:selenium-dependent xanthine dehydrogenase [Brachyspira aalborgi]|uniref:Selenium-dependent xanthine dehydrogenase n=1 Tax=Brachyspira aalborgi TaxID=29522 RepID=A0A5C8CLX4_9SPIR|nr:selenium-dependent xanthine dehydrogenase [Brachyspira aalborgi]TXJ13291.1 selenium-dependent xanthine dehydrogenase [Brachyspira aalborgi]